MTQISIKKEHERQSYWNAEIETGSSEELWNSIEKPLLKKQIEYTFENSAFYRKKLTDNGFTRHLASDPANFGNLPLTSKREILDDQAAYPPYGSLLAVGLKHIRRINRTSGYSGRPLFIVLTENDTRQIQEAGARAFWSSGLRPDDVVVHCLNYCMWSGGITDHMCLEETGATVIPFGVGNSKQLIQTMLDLKPTAISCTPSYMARLELMLRKEFNMEPAALGLKKGFFGGESGLQIANFRKNLEETWGIRAMDANYGISDVLSIFASECEYRCGFHHHGQGIVHLEIIDPSSGKILPLVRGSIGELVFTNMKREAQPLIRFRSGDVAEIVGDDVCRCGRTSIRYKVIGRSDNMLVIKGINLFPTAVQDAILKIPGLNGEYEIVLKTPPPHESFDLVVEYTGSKPEDGLERRISDSLRESLTVSAQIHLVPEGTILRTDGKKARIQKEY